MDHDQDDPTEHVSGRWTFLTNHAHVLVLLAQNPSIILREVAATIGITERAVQKIIADLEGEGFIIREKVGRQNHYRINRDANLKHPVEAHRTIGDLLRIIDH
jgi:predicted ArsR family transcriptional regulator